VSHTALHLFCELGGGALGFERAVVRTSTTCATTLEAAENGDFLMRAEPVWVSEVRV